ncbi:MAG: hypothetical protein ABJE95_36530 [Byssovorax sp.]
MSAPRVGDRLFLAAATGLGAAIVAYAILRGVERAFYTEPHPALLIWSDRSAFLWRAQESLYAGGLGAFGGYALAGFKTRVRWLGALIVAAVSALLLQALIAP